MYSSEPQCGQINLFDSMVCLSNKRFNFSLRNRAMPGVYSDMDHIRASLIRHMSMAVQKKFPRYLGRAFVHEAQLRLEDERTAVPRYGVGIMAESDDRSSQLHFQLMVHRETGSRVLALGILVVVSPNQVLDAVQALRDGLKVAERAERQVAAYIDSVLRLDALIPVLDERFMHLIKSREGTPAVTDDASVAKMEVRGKPNHFNLCWASYFARVFSTVVISNCATI